MGTDTTSALALPSHTLPPHDLSSPNHPSLTLHSPSHTPLSPVLPAPTPSTTLAQGCYGRQDRRVPLQKPLHGRERVAVDAQPADQEQEEDGLQTLAGLCGPGLHCSSAVLSSPGGNTYTGDHTVPLYAIHCTLHTAHCTLQTAHYKLHNSLDNVNYALYAIH